MGPLCKFMKNLAHIYETDTLVIGAGIAGQAVASRLAGGPNLSIIAESGSGFRHRHKVRVDSKWLRVASPSKFRRFGVGGTSLIWGGNLLPFTNLELQKFLSHSEVSAVQSEIVPSLKFLGIFEAAPEIFQTWSDRYLGSKERDLKEQILVRSASGAPKITPNSMTPSPFQKFIEGLWCIEIRARPDGSYTSLFTTRGGSQVHIISRRVVVATGSLEALRLLQASPTLNINRKILGERFSTHLTGPIGILSTKKGLNLKTHSIGDAVAQEFHHISWTSHPGTSAWKVTYLPLRNSLFEVLTLGWAVFDVLLTFIRDRLNGRSTYLINVDGDQHPQADSKVVFDKNQSLTIRTRTSSIDLESFEYMRSSLLERFSGNSQVCFFSKPFRRLLGRSHHLGGTPIGDSPDEALVDSNLSLFAHPGVHVCTSSVFPSFSSANPTLLLVQLALRLGKKLAGEN
jgi:choline dehydrogenase-like flavoprotein